MADCVVPQEYGTTIEEKRSVGVKICHGLLEKIKYDINIARTDNDVDMRYVPFTHRDPVGSRGAHAAYLLHFCNSIARAVNLTLNQSSHSQQVSH